MTTFVIIRTVVRRQRFVVEARDPGDAVMRVESGEAGRGTETVGTEIVAYEEAATPKRISL